MRYDLTRDSLMSAMDVPVIQRGPTIKNHRPRHSVTHAAHRKSDGHSLDIGAQHLEAPLAERSNHELRPVPRNPVLFSPSTDTQVPSGRSSRPNIPYSGLTLASYLRVFRIRCVFCYT